MRAEGKNREPGNSSSLIPHPSSLAIAFVLGAVTVAGHAPFYIFPLPVAALALLFYLWQRAANARAAAFVGFAYGLGLFLSGVSWVYVSLHDFGAMPAPLAMLATFLFCAFIAALPAAAGYASARFDAPPALKLSLAVPAIWTLSEWVRGWIFTGFPWLAAGYSQVPLSPLAGYAPVLGIYGVTLATAVTAGLIVVLGLRMADRAQIAGRGVEEKESNKAETSSSLIPHPSSLAPAIILLALWAGGSGLKQIAWTTPVGEPVTVSLLQGNIAQDFKWSGEGARAALEAYRMLAGAASGRLVVLPETALPMFLDQVPPDYLGELAARARGNGGDILVGVPERMAGGEYYNSVISYGAAASQTYRKSHLVPFGEFIPLRPVLGWIVSVLAIPLQDFSRGGEEQQPLEVAGQRVAVNICYEDAFGEEIIRQLPQATLLVNVSNVAWFGRSLAPWQHLQISQARALETGRAMLRATNTGVTAVIDARGEVVAAAPEYTTAVVSHTVQGYGGATPYVRWGNTALLALCLAALAVARWRRPAKRVPRPRKTL
ncbi:MAG: apolipoprotein N-acyltransferase [Betaproteobacteria bacterium]|nr:apolipoprotein N-acyltransferase [Betaproteobacteria bacterium]